MSIRSPARTQVIGLSILCVVAACAVTWMRIGTVKNTYTYVQNQKELNRLQQELQAERVKWLKLTSPKKLELLARHLGLAAPKMTQVVRLHPAPKTRGLP
ncbi:MAG: hypothetical protein HYR96_14490 [Deltaproteobacteria bacterium]|nr:hypothetical protein [Deltaproteobacteria bacterium]MBI3295509.1 hypothetical protein [Deltaproteobacteria bacterium]